MTNWLANNPVSFDGQVNVVQVDETALGGKQKYHRGCNVCTRWLFGLLQKETHKIHLEFVPDRQKLTLLPIIYRHVNRGSTINSDGAKCYKSLIHMGYTNNVVIHKQEFITPNGIHTNGIENIWSNLKSVLKQIRGSQGRMVDGHVDEFVYQYNRKHEGDVFHLLLQDIANIYPPN